jgi:uncharacterized protein YjbI with pentapeptide repeats
MLTLLGVALFCVLTVFSSPDTLLLAADSAIKVPVAEAPLSFVGFIVVAPLLLLVLTVYLHIFFRYWLACERERQSLNQRMIPPIESMPTLFSCPDKVSRWLTGFVFYWLVPSVLVTITWKAWALPEKGLPLTYVSGLVTLVLGFLQIRRRPDNQRQWWTSLGCTILILIIGFMALVTCNRHRFQRPLNLFRAELANVWLVGKDMSYASASFANLPGANLFKAKLPAADLSQANLQKANLYWADLQAADLSQANLQEADLTGAKLKGGKLPGANLFGAKLPGADLTGANLWGAILWEANLHDADLSQTSLQEANLHDADLSGAKLWGANLTEAIHLTQDQVNTACVDEDTKLPEGLTTHALCPNTH